LIASGALGKELIGDGVEGYEVKSGNGKRKLNAALIVGIVGVMLAVCFGIALLGFTRGWFGEKSGLSSSTISIPSDSAEGPAERVEVTTWTSGVMRDLLISQTTGEALYCCGNAFVTARSGIDFQNGAFLVGGTPVARGDIADLEPVSKLTGLVELALCYETITDVSALGALNHLTYLDLSGNDITDISPLKGLSGLATLKLSHTSVTDLTSVLEMSGLKKIYISYDMVAYAEAVLAGDFEIIITN